MTATTRVIRVDSEVYKLIKDASTSWEDTPNRILRELLGLSREIKEVDEDKPKKKKRNKK